MLRKDLALAGVAGAIFATVATAGTQIAFAQGAHALGAHALGAHVLGGHAVNPAPIAPGAGLAPGSFADIIQRVAPAVVSIEVDEKPTPASAVAGDPLAPFRQMFPGLPDMPEARPSGPVKVAGSGFFVSADGYIVTNNHVVEGARKITVHTEDDRELPAMLVGRDPATDLAVIKVASADHPFVSFEDRAKPRVGDWVVALGNPYGLSGTATAGIVSALRRPNISGSSYVDYMQIDAPINRGNSGGPSFDVYGRVVGVNSAIFSPSGGSVGIGFDIPADVAARVVHQLISTGKVVRGYIGATVQDVTPDIAASLGLRANDGALVADVTPGGPSDRAGLRQGDIVERVDGRRVSSASELTRAVALVAPGQEVRLDVRRDGRPLALTLRADVRPSEEQLAQGGGAPGPYSGAVERGSLGLAVAPNAGGGLRVEQVDPSSDAAAKGIQPGDVLQAINGRRVASVGDVRQAMVQARAQGRHEVLLLVSRGGQHLYVPVEPEKGAG